MRSRRGVGEARKPVQPLFSAFYISAAMIILRSIFRLIGELSSLTRNSFNRTKRSQNSRQSNSPRRVHSGTHSTTNGSCTSGTPSRSRLVASCRCTPERYLISTTTFSSLFSQVSVFVLSVIHAGKYLPRQKGLRIDGTMEDPAPSRVCGCCCIYKRCDAVYWHLSVRVF